jgi:hypothetical protein
MFGKRLLAKLCPDVSSMRDTYETVFFLRGEINKENSKKRKK